jgi:predicted nucleic acid-binding protein
VIVYLDSSVILRIVLREPDPLAEWNEITEGVTSTLTRVEAARTIDRNAVLHTASDEALSEKRTEIADILRRVDFVPMEDAVLDEAARPRPFVLGALDAIHLASAILYREGQPFSARRLLFATHDLQLARAARAMHFEVLGA